jgi:RNA polymerase sigma-70 factor, ECF subfamily
MDFDEIYKIYGQKVFRLCMGYVNDVDWAKDLAQETFITVWQKLAQFKNQSSVGTWVFRIAANICLRQIEKQNRMVKAALPEHIADYAPQNIEAKVQFLYKSIAELPEIDRIVISLELEDLNQSEIANIVGLSEANVRVKIHRIKEKLSKKFKNFEHA